MEQKLNDSFGQVSEDLKWGAKYGIPVYIPVQARSDFPQLDHPVILSAWNVREDCNSLLDWLIDGEHEPVILLEQANPQEYSDRLDRLEKQITQNIKDNKSEEIYNCAEVYCLMENYKGQLRERDRTIAQYEKEKKVHLANFNALFKDLEERDRQIEKLNHEYQEFQIIKESRESEDRAEIAERDRQLLRLNHYYNESTDDYKKEIEERDRTIQEYSEIIENREDQIGDLALERQRAKIHHKRKSIALGNFIHALKGKLQTSEFNKKQDSDLFQEIMSERDRTIAQQSAKEQDLITKIELLQHRLNNFPRIDYGIQGILEEIQKHLISLEVDLKVLGYWEKDWRKVDYSNLLAHARKCALLRQKVSQVKSLTAIVEKLLGTCEVSSKF
jgi:hypothetical protein